MIEKVHTSHNGIEATLRLARDNIFWPGMSEEIKNRVQGCDVCVKYSSNQRKPPMQTFDIPEYPFQIVSMDVFFAQYQGKQRKFLVTVDHYSDYFELDILKDMTPSSIINCCKKNFGRFGVPEMLCSDNGTNFVNKEIQNFSKMWQFTQVTSSPYHQQGNGKAEAAVKIAKNLLKKAEESKEDIWFSLLHWRNIPNKINSSPAQRLLSRSTRNSVPSAISKLKPRCIENVTEQIKQNRQKSKMYYDKKTTVLPELEKGTPVMVQVNPESTSVWSKGTIREKLCDRSYVVDARGSSYRRNIVNIKPHESFKVPIFSESAQPKPIEESPEEVHINQSNRPCINNEHVAERSEETGRELEKNVAVMSKPIDIVEKNKAEEAIPEKNIRPKRTIKLPQKYKDFHVFSIKDKML